jgi:hypothetical protein
LGKKYTVSETETINFSFSFFKIFCSENQTGTFLGLCTTLFLKLFQNLFEICSQKQTETFVCLKENKFTKKLCLKENKFTKKLNFILIKTKKYVFYCMSLHPYYLLYGGFYERLSPKRTSPKRTSPKRTSPKRTSPKRTSPKRTSPKRTSPKRTSPKRTSPKRTSLNASQSLNDEIERLKDKSFEIRDMLYTVGDDLYKMSKLDVIKEYGPKDKVTKEYEKIVESKKLLVSLRKSFREDIMKMPLIKGFLKNVPEKKVNELVKLKLDAAATLAELEIFKMQIKFERDLLKAKTLEKRLAVLKKYLKQKNTLGNSLKKIYLKV